MFTVKQKHEILDDIVPALLIGSVMTCVIVGAMAISNAKEKEKQAQQVRENNELADAIIGNVEPNEVKVFNEGEHYLSVRLYENSTQTVQYAVNNIPEGYEVYDIMPYEVDGNTEGYDIWFTNTEQVEVQASYNTEYDQYGYYTFGDPIEKGKTLTK